MNEGAQSQLAANHPNTECFKAAIIHYSPKLASGGSAAGLGQAGHVANWSELVLLHAASPLAGHLGIFSWYKQGSRTVEMYSTFQASNCIKFASVSLAKANYEVKPIVHTGGLPIKGMHPVRDEIWDNSTTVPCTT